MAEKAWVKRRGMTAIPNETVYDVNLSYRALGLLLAVLSRPEDAPQGYRDLVRTTDGEHGVRSALRELNDAGYRHQFRMHGKGGRMVTHTVVSETPMDHDDALAWLSGQLEAAKHGAVDKSSTVRRKPRHGAPRGGNRRIGTFSTSKGSSLRSEPGETNARARASTAAPCGRCDGSGWVDRPGDAGGVYRCPECSEPRF